MNSDTLSRMYEGLKKVNTVFASISGIILLFVTFSIFVDVFLRYFFNRPSTWITEVSTYLFLYIIFFSTSYALQSDLHIRVNFLTTYLPDSYVRWIDPLTSIFCIIFSAVLLWQTSSMTWAAYSENWTTPTMLGVHYTWIYAAMVVGSVFLLITFILRTALQFSSMKNQQ
jgi:C4-dicarboxylate transporter DctQ subunit